VSTVAANPAAAKHGLAQKVVWREALFMYTGITALILVLLVTIAAPLGVLLLKSFEDKAGAFVGLDNYIRYFSTPSLVVSLWNSIWIAALSTVIVVGLAFGYAYALTRTRMPLKSLLTAIAMLPLFAPSLLSAISFIYIFGNQGFLKSWLFGGTIYGPIGIVLSQVFYCFPHAMLILTTALALADGRLYEAAEALGTSKARVFWTITLPGIKYGLVSAAFVVFTLVITDFGIAKVIGGQFNVLATDAYKQVIGQQNFSMGAVVGFILLLPAVLAFIVDRQIQKKQVAQLSARAVPLDPKPFIVRDTLFLVYCGVIALLIIGVLAMAVWASFVMYWPYNLSLSTKWYNFGSVFRLGQNGADGIGHWHGDSVHRGLPDRKGRPVRIWPDARALAGDAANGGAGAGAGSRLCVLHQRAVEPARCVLRHAVAAGGQHHGAFLHHRPHHRRYRLEAD
jgi:iron(III) transport system permease protein